MQKCRCYLFPLYWIDFYSYHFDEGVVNKRIAKITIYKFLLEGWMNDEFNYWSLTLVVSAAQVTDSNLDEVKHIQKYPLKYFIIPSGLYRARSRTLVRLCQVSILAINTRRGSELGRPTTTLQPPFLYSFLLFDSHIMLRIMKNYSMGDKINTKRMKLEF